VTMGGNDLLAAYGSAAAARQAIATVAGNGRQVLAALRAMLGPGAPIVVATVYDPSDGTGDVARLGVPPWPEVLDLLDELNRVLERLATEHRALVGRRARTLPRPRLGRRRPGPAVPAPSRPCPVVLGAHHAGDLQAWAAPSRGWSLRTCRRTRRSWTRWRGCGPT
jgi:hypothetical protein